MAGNKKKKKPATNPARGFATTSTASKPKLEKKADASTDASETASIVTVPVSVASDDVQITEVQRELHELSPEELEAELETSELQSMVDRFASKVRKEASRQVQRMQTDRRILRGQAEYLQTRDWLPEELMMQIIELARQETLHGRATSDQRLTVRTMSEDDGTIKIWTLYHALVNLQFPETRVKEVIRYILKFPPSGDAGSQMWGLQESLDWLALECEQHELPDYESALGRSVHNSNVISRPDSPIPEIAPLGMQNFESTPATTENSSSSRTGSTRSPAASHDDSTEVSDLESDLEPEELISTYLSTKAQLYNLRPDLVMDVPSNNRKARARLAEKATGITPLPSGVLKLQKKMQKIESDILFDQHEADQHWIGRKNELAQQSAARRALQIPQAIIDTKRAEITNTRSDSAVNSVMQEAALTASQSMGEEAEEAEPETEDNDMLGGMFEALPDDTDDTAKPINGISTASDAIRIRNFENSTGMSPRRVLEEACRARDSGAKLAYKLVSPTTYSSRHALTIKWTKEQDVVDISCVPSVTGSSGPWSLTVTMATVATPDTVQSEAYISTVALFLVFSTSPKEEKAYLRLPPNWRDLWAEFAELRKAKTDAVDRETVREFREMFREQITTEEEDGVVLKNGFRKRNKGTGTPEEVEVVKPKSNGFSMANPEQLRDLWQRKCSTASYQRMLISRMNLPMFRFRDAALSAISCNQVIIICGETGCGKSTQLPAFILEHELSQGRQCKVYCTEPRRISAISLAQRVSEELGEQKKDIGTDRSLVGYAIRLESYVTAQTRLVYATVGIVLRMLESAKGLDDITHLVLDEIHERSIDTDFLLIVLRSLMVQRPELKVVLMSATVDAQKFSRYLNNAPIVVVPGRTFPVQAKYLEDAIELTDHTPDGDHQSFTNEVEDHEDIVADGASSGIPNQLTGYSPKTRNTLSKYNEYQIDYSLIVKIIEKVAYAPLYSKYSRAVLIFLPGIAEIRQLNDMLHGHPSFSQGWLVYPLHSTIASEDQQQAFLVPPPGVRKIVIATNIAETGITIPDVTCVIDAGKHKEMRFDERRQLSRLVQSFISRANAKQRRGRAGRVQEGLCFHLFTKYRHDELMAEQQTPEMLRLSLQDLVMRVKTCKLGDIEQTLSDALDPPSSRNIRRAIDALVEVNALTPTEELTHLGQQLAKLPLDAHLGKLVLLASVFGCLDFALTTAAILSSKSPFVTPMGAKKQADTVRLGFKRGDSDLLTAYNAYCAWRRVCTTPGTSEAQFCRRSFLSPQNLSNIEDLKAQLLASLVDAGFVTLNNEERAALNQARYASRYRTFVPVPSHLAANNDNDLIANSVVAWSFYPKLLVRDGKGWCNVANNQSVSLHPTSVNKGVSSSRYLSFYHIMQSSTKFTNAHETSPCTDVALALLAGEADFRLYAGVLVIDGNRLRFAVSNWKTLVALKMMRTRLKETVSRAVRFAGKPLSGQQVKWMDLWRRVMEQEGRKAK